MKIGFAGAFMVPLILSGTAFASGNLVTNGSFEDSAVSGSWNLFDALPGWTLASGPAIEIQRGVGGWGAAEGAQWVELDADQNGPGGGTFANEIGSSFIEQELQTTPGQLYLLTLAFSARPGVADNQLAIEWNGALVADYQASGIGLSNTSWETISLLLEADGTSSTLGLGDLSVNDTLGTFVDNVSVVAVPGPASLGALAFAFTLGLNRRRRS